MDDDQFPSDSGERWILKDNEEARKAFARQAEQLPTVEGTLNLKFTDELDDMLLFDEIERVHKAPLN